MTHARIQYRTKHGTHLVRPTLPPQIVEVDLPDDTIISFTLPQGTLEVRLEGEAVEYYYLGDGQHVRPALVPLTQYRGHLRLIPRDEKEP